MSLCVCRSPTMVEGESDFSHTSLESGPTRDESDMERDHHIIAETNIDMEPGLQEAEEVWQKSGLEWGHEGMETEGMTSREGMEESRRDSVLDVNSPFHSLPLSPLTPFPPLSLPLSLRLTLTLSHPPLHLSLSLPPSPSLPHPLPPHSSPRLSPLPPITLSSTTRILQVVQPFVHIVCGTEVPG